MRLKLGAMVCLAAIASSGAGLVEAAAPNLDEKPIVAGPSVRFGPGEVPRLITGEGRAASQAASEHEPGQARDAIRVAQADNLNFAGNPALAPLKWVGLLVNPMPTADSPNSAETCTGQFIKPNIVLTAGHCIKAIQDDPDTPGFDLSKQYFVLQYQNGEGSETYKTVCAATNPLWKLPADYKKMSAADQETALLTAYQHDFAMVLVDGNSVTGVMPYKLDWKGEEPTVTRVGYTTGILDNRIIQVAPGVLFFADTIRVFPKPFADLVMHWEPVTTFTFGSSGGAWISNFSTRDAPGNNVLVAVTSFGPKLLPGGEGAAYLTSAEFNPLLAYVSNGCK